MKKTPEEIRQTNLRQLLEEKFQGDTNALSAAIHKGKSTIAKYLSKAMTRTINANTARAIERHLNLDSGYLDEEYHGNSQVYYVTLKVSRNFTFDVVKHIYEYPEAVECSSVLGEFDILIKVEVPSYHELQVFYDKLSRMPGVHRTRTFPAVETIRWQRAQSAYYELVSPNELPNYAEKYRHERILEYMEEIRKLEHGEVSSDSAMVNQVDLCELMHQVKRSYLAIRLHDETYPNEEAYIRAEQSRLHDDVQVKRIITLPQVMASDRIQTPEFHQLLDKAHQLIHMGTEVRFVFNEDWITSERSKAPECFAVVDGEYVYQKTGEGQSRLLMQNDDVSKFLKAFNVNWERGKRIEDILAI